MNSEIFLALAQAIGRPDLIGPLALGRVATDLFAFALGLKRPSSLFKKLDSNPDDYPPLHEAKGTRRKYFKLAEIEVWHAGALMPAMSRLSPSPGPGSQGAAKPMKRAGRPRKSEQREAQKRGISVAQLRSLATEGCE